MKEKIQKIWKDPVLSNVIAAGMIALGTTLYLAIYSIFQKISFIESIKNFIAILKSKTPTTNYLIVLFSIFFIFLLYKYLKFRQSFRRSVKYPEEVISEKNKPGEIQLTVKESSSNLESGKIAADEAVWQILKNKNSEFSKFWKLFLNDSSYEEIFVILSAKGKGEEYIGGKPIKKSGHTLKVSYNEVKGFLRLQEGLSSLKKKFIVIHGGVNYEDESGKRVIIHAPQYRKDKKLIIVGSSNANNECKCFINEKLNLPYKFEKWTENDKEYKIVRTNSGKYPTNFEESENVEKDFGLIARVTNPLSGTPDNKILILGGNHGLGTQSALDFVTEPTAEMKKIRKKAGKNDFVALFEAHADESEGYNLKILEIAKLEGYNWNEQDMSGF